MSTSSKTWNNFSGIMSEMFRFFWKIEEYLYRNFLRVIRGGGTINSVTISDIQILQETPNFILINKHYDVIINGGLPDQVTVAKQMERLYPDLVNNTLPFKFFFPHRLDYSTSGVLCLAKTKRSCAAAGMAFEKRNSKKFYLAILRGHLSKDFLTIDESIGRDKREKYNGIRMATEVMPNCSSNTRNATTKLIVLQRGICYGYPATKVILRPITGRRHQLRVHCSSIGHTIVGDYTYSNRKDIHPFRMFLHAYKLELITKIETININTEDPFEESNPKNHWQSTQDVFSIQDAIYELNLSLN